MARSKRTGPSRKSWKHSGGNSEKLKKQYARREGDMILLDSECEYEGRGVNRMLDTYQFDASYTFDDIDNRLNKVYTESQLGRYPYEYEPDDEKGIIIVKVTRYERVPDYLERRANKLLGPA